jgi:cell cycle checkpoint protein
LIVSHSSASVSSFNPIADTFLRKGLQTVLSRARVASPGSEALELIIATSNGDIRSGINTLQFVCSSGLGELGIKSGNKKNKKGKNGISRSLLEGITRREQSMALFHLIGRILYNKR